MVSSALHLHANTIEAKERQFAWFLLCTLLPLFALTRGRRARCCSSASAVGVQQHSTRRPSRRTV
jgi:hypothetical protein